MVKRIYLNSPWSLSCQFCFVAVVFFFLFFFSCAVYCLHTICWCIQGNLNKEQNNDLGMISAFLILCRIFPLPLWDVTKLRGNEEQGTNKGNREIWKMEQNRAMGNEVTDRARVQDRFCSQNTYTSPHTSELAPLYFLIKAQSQLSKEFTASLNSH